VPAGIQLAHAPFEHRGDDRLQRPRRARAFVVRCVERIDRVSRQRRTVETQGPPGRRNGALPPPSATASRQSESLPHALDLAGERVVPRPELLLPRGGASVGE